MELSYLAIIMLIFQPVFVYLYIKSTVRPSIFIASPIAMSVFYTSTFFHAVCVLGGINLVGVLLVKLAERKGYTRFSTSYFISGVICWFILFGVISFISSFISLPPMSNLSDSFSALFSFPKPIVWPIITFFSITLLVLAICATVFLLNKNQTIATKALIIYALTCPILPIFSNYFWISHLVTFLVVVKILGACEKYFYKTHIANDEPIALAYAGSFILSCVIYFIGAISNLY